MRIWAKQFKENHLIRDVVIERNDPDMSRTKKVLTALEEVCHDWDIAVPIWLDTTIRDFQNHAKARFYQDNFTESIDFDFLEFHVIEE